MIEQIVLDYLEGQEDLPPVYMERPASLPSTPFIVLEKTGSSMRNHIYSATIAAQSYAPTMLEAAQLNEAVKAAMLDIVALPEISAVDFTDYNFTDTALKRYRYQAVFDIIHY